ncbi:MAG: FAD-dependent oxidoreductase [Thermoleophilia bacterium]
MIGLRRERHEFDLAVIGMGSAGGVAVSFAARLGLSVAAIERERIGGDCLWTGCVPSKALLASAKAAHHVRTAARYGVLADEPRIDLPAVWRRIRAVQEEIAAADDSPERFADLGATVVTGDARLVGPHAVRVGERTLDARAILVCTGSRPAVPDVPGLADQAYLTSETLWQLGRPPASLVVLGGGPIGCELAQALQRLGVRVTLVQRGPALLPRDEPALAALLADVLRGEGVDLRLGAEAVRVEGGHAGVRVVVRSGGRDEAVDADGVLVAAGRRPNVEGLGLEELGVAVGPRGIVVDEHLRTSVRSIYAAGDVAGRHLFTHAAGQEAAIAVRNVAFPGSSRPARLVPWCTFTDPELAHAGLTETEAVERHGPARVRVRELDLGHSDRARADGTTVGSIRLVEARGRLVGAHVLAPAAGELIGELALAIDRKLPLARLGALVHPYPTLSTSVNLLGAHAAFDRVRPLLPLLRRARPPGRD